MEIFQLQDRLILLVRGRFNYSSRSVLQRNSPFILVLIILTHLILIFLVSNIKSKHPENLPFETVMQLRDLQSENTFSVSEPEIPNINVEIKPVQLAVPEISFNENYKSRLDLSAPPSDNIYELPHANAELYKDVFDPVLRKKLQEAHANRKSKKHDALNTWETSGGTTLVDMGDGECIASMPKIDARQRGTTWSMLRVKCGKTDSEKMMDNVTADLEARKHPLQIQ
jgi:hypothetical protein